MAGDATVLDTYYKAFFTELKARNIEVIAELYHFDMPELFPSGWLDPTIKDQFVAYAEQCFAALDDVVDVWVPIGNAQQEVRTNLYWY